MIQLVAALYFPEILLGRCKVVYLSDMSSIGNAVLRACHELLERRMAAFSISICRLYRNFTFC